MISYEQVRQALRTSTITIIIINAISMVITLFGLAGIFFLKSQLDKPEFRAQFSAEQLRLFEVGISPFTIFMSVISLGLVVLTTVLCGFNLSKIKQGTTVSYVPYIIGIVLYLISIISQLFSQIELVSMAIVLAELALYGFAFYKAKTLNEKDKDKTQSIEE